MNSHHFAEDAPGGNFRWWWYRHRARRAIRRGLYGAAAKILDWWWPANPKTITPEEQRIWTARAARYLAKRMGLLLEVNMTAKVDLNFIEVTGSWKLPDEEKP